MEQIHIERLDHLGVIASVIKDLGLISMIDTRLVPDKQEVITPGEAVAAMILNGLGFANRPLSLTPQFFASKPLDLLFRAGIDAEMFNRFKRGRTLDEASAYGCDLLFQGARSQGSNPWQTQGMALDVPLLEHFPLDPISYLRYKTSSV
jgi:transposase